MKLSDLELNESLSAKSLKTAIEAFVKKVSSVGALKPFIERAKAQQEKLKSIFKAAKSADDLNAELKRFAEETMQKDPIKEHLDEGVYTKLMGGALSTFAAGAAVLLAKSLNIYHQMGQPDFLPGSHVNMVGGFLFGVLPALLYVAFAILCFTAAHKEANR